MRWKLILIASLLATLTGTGVTLGVVFGLLGSHISLATSGWLVIATLIIPVLAITVASIFVYRHTARRRRLQAMLTALLAGSLTLAILITSSIISFKPVPAPTPAPQPSNTV